MVKPIVIGVCGASAQPLAEKAIKMLLKNKVHTDLVISAGAYKVWKSEINVTVPLEPSEQKDFWSRRLKEDVSLLNCYKPDDNSARIASGSFKTQGMIIIPCSMGTLGRIANGVSMTLIERSADVHLKEKRKLILVPRETPLNLIHLKNMTTLSEAGAHIIPPIPAWYTKPKTIDELLDFIIMRVFDSLDIDFPTNKRWGK
tara:strand:- start:1085 stop:1687 length:603 start_codon:yes stop_codon:yes gene_type:complete